MQAQGDCANSRLRIKSNFLTLKLQNIPSPRQLRGNCEALKSLKYFVDSSFALSLLLATHRDQWSSIVTDHWDHYLSAYAENELVWVTWRRKQKQRSLVCRLMHIHFISTWMTAWLCRLILWRWTNAPMCYLWFTAVCAVKITLKRQADFKCNQSGSF